MARRRQTGTVTRFAPSPTGLLHLGHAYSALFAAHAAGGKGDRFLLRIEDIDPGRCRPEFAKAIEEDLAWLGLKWEKPVRRQSAHMKDYRAALSSLERKGVLYPCFCTRKEIVDEIAQAGHAPHGPDGPIYPGTCRRLPLEVRERRIEKGDSYAMRIDMAQAVAMAGPLKWTDRSQGTVTADPLRFGDVVLARKDTPTSYHLSVTVDDHLQGVTLVTRGADLLQATHIHRLLQALLGYETPEYHHHRLLTAENGRRLAKRDTDLTLKGLREAGYTPEEVRHAAGFDD